MATDKLKCGGVTAGLNSSFYLAAIFFFLATRYGMQDLSSPTRDQTHALSSESTVLTTGPPGKSLVVINLNGNAPGSWPRHWQCRTS